MFQNFMMRCSTYIETLVTWKKHLFHETGYCLFFVYFAAGCDATYGNICYTYHNTQVTWQQASDACVALGAQLIDIEDEKENEIMHFMISGNNVFILFTIIIVHYILRVHHLKIRNGYDD